MLSSLLLLLRNTELYFELTHSQREQVSLKLSPKWISAGMKFATKFSQWEELLSNFLLHRFQFSLIWSKYNESCQHVSTHLSQTSWMEQSLRMTSFWGSFVASGGQHRRARRTLTHYSLIFEIFETRRDRISAKFRTLAGLQEHVSKIEIFLLLSCSIRWISFGEYITPHIGEDSHWAKWGFLVGTCEGSLLLSSSSSYASKATRD